MSSGQASSSASPAAATAGRLIALEGGEGTGKSTQIKLLQDFLQSQGKSVLVTREPGGTAGGEAIRALLVSGAVDRWDAVSELLLHYAARREHVIRLIKPALARGEWVISDRFADSSLVYQGMVQAVGIERVLDLHELVLGGFWPDLTLILDLPASDGLDRASARDQGQNGRYEEMGAAFHEAVGQGFRRLAARYPGRCVLVDAVGNPEAVAGRVAEAVRQRLMAPA
ncbi:MAG: dTMP kinase [Sphingomonadales bacterium]